MSAQGASGVAESLVEIDGVLWAWRAGKAFVVFRNQQGKKHRCRLREVASRSGNVTQRRVVKHLEEHAARERRGWANQHAVEASMGRHPEGAGGVGGFAVAAVLSAIPIGGLVDRMVYVAEKWPRRQRVDAESVEKRPHGDGWKLEAGEWIRELRAWGTKRPRGDGWKRRDRVDKDTDLRCEQIALLNGRGKAVYCWERPALPTERRA